MTAYRLTVKLASLVGGDDIAGRLIRVAPYWPDSIHRTGQGRIVGTETWLPTPLPQCTDDDGTAVLIVEASADANDARYRLVVENGPTWQDIEMPSHDAAFSEALIDRGIPQVPLNPATQALDRVRHDGSLQGDGTGDSLLGTTENTRVTDAALDPTQPEGESRTAPPSRRATAAAIQSGIDIAQRAAADDLDAHNRSAAAHPLIETALSRLNRQSVTQQGEITALQGERQEFSMQVQATPAGVATLADLLDTDIDLTLGEITHVPSNVRGLALFVQNATRDTADQVGDTIRWDVRRPPSVIRLPRVTQADLDAVGARAGDGWLNMALTTLNGAGGVVGDRTIEFAVGIGRAVPAAGPAPQPSSAAGSYGDVGILTAGRAGPGAGGYAYDGYNPASQAFAATGQVRGLQNHPIGGLYTVVNPGAVPNVEAGKTYFALPNVQGHTTPPPVAVIIDERAYKVSAAFGVDNRFFEVLDFDGLTDGSDYRVNVMFADGLMWIERYAAAFDDGLDARNPFVTCQVLPMSLASDRLPNEMVVVWGGRRIRKRVTALTLVVNGESIAMDSNTPLGRVANSDYGTIKFDPTNDQRDTLEDNVDANAGYLAAVQFTFDDGTGYRYRQAIAVNTRA